MSGTVAGSKPGPSRRPNLQVVAEGNPGHRSQSDLEGGLKLPPEAPAEPDWLETFPALKGISKKKRAELKGAELRARKQAEVAGTKNARARTVARREWRRIVPILNAQGLLASVDFGVLHDYCVCMARIDMCERDISMHGVWVPGERGAQKNPSVTAANQYRTYLKFYIAELGLSPSSRNGLEGRGEDGDDDNPFDI